LHGARRVLSTVHQLRDAIDGLMSWITRVLGEVDEGA
jgi:hypothetical protein